MHCNPRRLAKRIGATLAVATALSAAAVTTASAGTLAGVATPSPTSGGSSTSFTLSLPAQSACSGDTTNNGYHVFGYITQADPSTLTFNANGPSSGFTLYRAGGGSAYRGEATALGGAIQAIPAFDFSNFGSTDQGGNLFALPPGVYHVGIACATTLGVEDKYWDSTFTFTASGSDPNGETWVARTTIEPTQGSGFVLPLVGVAMLGGGVLFERRRRSGRSGVSGMSGKAPAAA